MTFVLELFVIVALAVCLVIVDITFRALSSDAEKDDGVVKCFADEIEEALTEEELDKNASASDFESDIRVESDEETVGRIGDELLRCCDNEIYDNGDFSGEFQTSCSDFECGEECLCGEKTRKDECDSERSLEETLCDDEKRKEIGIRLGIVVDDASSRTVDIGKTKIESGTLSEERSNMTEIDKIEVESDDLGGSVSTSEEYGVLEDLINDPEGYCVQKETGLFDDWEVIERTELEKRFADAVAFVASNSSNIPSLISNEVKMQLRGIQKVATEGICSKPQPTALKVFARSGWNDRKQLRNMSPEVAMEQYIALVSRNIPFWI